MPCPCSADTAHRLAEPERYNAATSASSAAPSALFATTSTGTGLVAEASRERGVLLGDPRLRVDDQQDRGRPRRSHAPPARPASASTPRASVQVPGGVDQPERPPAPRRVRARSGRASRRACRARSLRACRTGGSRGSTCRRSGARRPRSSGRARSRTLRCRSRTTAIAATSSVASIERSPVSITHRHPAPARAGWSARPARRGSRSPSRTVLRHSADRRSRDPRGRSARSGAPEGRASAARRGTRPVPMSRPSITAPRRAERPLHARASARGPPGGGPRRDTLDSTSGVVSSVGRRNPRPRARAGRRPPSRTSSLARGRRSASASSASDLRRGSARPSALDTSTRC